MRCAVKAAGVCAEYNYLPIDDFIGHEFGFSVIHGILASEVKDNARIKT